MANDSAEPEAPEVNEPTGPGDEPEQSYSDKIHAQGFAGDKVDPEPNESYTIAGVTKS